VTQEALLLKHQFHLTPSERFIAIQTRRNARRGEIAPLAGCELWLFISSSLRICICLEPCNLDEVTGMSNILLVEDSPTQAMQMKLLLESASHQVVCCDDGTAALEHLASGTNELVVTDLELPVMNGLDLISKMRLDFPQIPAVLVTGQGSERLAAEALKIGATAYVPKTMVDEMLLGTVEDVLGVARTDRSYAELIDCTQENRLVFQLPNNPRLLVTAIDLTMQLASGMQLLTGVERYRVATALQHAAFNALFRGNLELTHDEWIQCSISSYESDAQSPLIQDRLNSSPYKDRTIVYDARLMRDVIRITIRDHGPGFDTRSIPKLDDASAIDDERGRGLVLIQRFFDKVVFNERGNEITLVKHVQHAAPQGSDSLPV
jgi:CheY-like chemotaxis protein